MLLKARVPLALAVASLAIIGCGSGGSDSLKPAPQPSDHTVVQPEPFEGLIGPVQRVTKTTSQSRDDRVPAKPGSNKPVRVHKNGVAGTADCPDADLQPADDNLPQVEAALLCLLNAVRAENGNLPALQFNPQLHEAADGMARRMVTEKFFAHETPDGTNSRDRATAAGYIRSDDDDGVVGENIAWGSGGNDTPQATVNHWLGSEAHKANMLAPDYKDVGFGEARGAPVTDKEGGTTVVADFGARSGKDPDFELPGVKQSRNDSEPGQPKQGEGSATVPSLRGKTLARAKARLKAAGLKLGKVKRVKSRIRKGRITAQLPGAGRHPAKGTRVALRISRGR